MNKVILSGGRLTADPDLKTTNTGIEYCTFTIAIDRKTGKDKEKITDFIPCKAWQKTAVFINSYFSKGKLITLEGSFNIDKYVDKDGENKTYSYINVGQVEFCGAKSDSTNNNNSVPASFNDNTNGFEEIGSIGEDLPFN